MYRLIQRKTRRKEARLIKTCNHYQQQISAFIDKELSAGERVALMEHMAHCRDCQQYYTHQIAIHEALSGLEAGAPAGFSDAVMARVRSTPRTKTNRKAFSRWQRWAAMAACLALVLVSAAAKNNFWPQPESRAAAVSDIAGPADTKNQADSFCLMDPSLSTASGESADDSALSPSSPLEDSAAALPQPKEEESPSTNGSEPARAQSFSISTDSDTARHWVESQLQQPWLAGRVYELTQEQYRHLLETLERAGAAFSEERADGDAPHYVLIAAE